MLATLLAFRIGFITLDWADAADIILVGLLIYELSRLVRGSVAGGVVLGGLILYMVYLLVKAAGMELLTAILDQFMGAGVIAAIILFQPELRKFLLNLAKGTASATTSACAASLPAGMMTTTALSSNLPWRRPVA